MNLSSGPLVSVIIPTYNSESYIRETLASVFAQTYHNFEVMVVDDGSSDQTAAVVKSYGDRVTFVAQANQGPAAARNHGIRLAKGELISFLDSDDLWLPDKLEKQVRFMAEHPEYGLISTDMSIFDSRGIIESGVKAKIYKIKTGMVMRDLLFGNWIQTSGVMVRKECFATVGHFTVEKGLWGEDWILWMQIAARYPVYFMAESLAKIRQAPQSFSHHDPDAQFWSLFRALEILKQTIPELRQNPELITQAANRICFVRALKDAHSDRFADARKKI
ncbi:MAG: glycosyltransferase family A protein, partial [Terriglobales bacterium]